MAGKKRNINIDELTADNKWDQVYRERDRIKADRIKSLDNRSKVYIVLGALLLFGAYDYLLDLVKNMKENTKGIEPNTFVWILVAAIAGLIFFYLAAKKNADIEKLNAERCQWMPDDDEISYIGTRFDKDFVRSVLSDISSEGTYSIEVGLDALTINNNTGPIVRNYNKCGFRSLTNYDTKQLAYYLASHSFPEGFTIYQTRTALAQADKIIGGTTDIGGDKPPQEDETRHTMRILSRLVDQMKEVFRIRKMMNPFTVASEGPAVADKGQIIINKGFKVQEEGYAEL